MTSLTPETLLKAYALGVFPMAENRDESELFFVDPEHRGIIPLHDLHVPRKLRRIVRQGRFEIRCNTAFDKVVEGCADARPETWINGRIRELYSQLHDMGSAHSVETWADGKLVGGLYGVSLGGAFFGESMYSLASHASKVALVHLVARLRHSGYRLLDTQFVTDHLESLGAVEVSRQTYQAMLQEALRYPVTFYSEEDATGTLVEGFLQSMTQTS